ncbi:dermonecrotic toxin domain-containing protein [Pseudomonas sp. NPDC089534]|uniref:dermonecrotic toxin domain-containing protein n=1 Tax=Pseudomonas sp. NPDC089534 TaxID=3364468 RepID=UPI0037FB4E80
MEVEETPTTPPQMTPAQQGVFFDLLKKQVPAWILDSSQDSRTALYESLKSSFRSRAAVLEDLSAFKSPEQFCAPLLAAALSAKLAEPVQVEGVVFQHVRSTSSLLGLRRKLVLPIDRDLLGAACENFELSETRADNYHERSLIYIPNRITGHTHKILPIQPHEFAQLCRVLDLGKSYQAHVSEFFGDKTQLGSLRKNAVTCLKDRFDVERHLAYMQRHIGKDVYEMLKSVVERKPSITLGKNALGYQQLKMLDTKLNGPMFIGPVSEHADDDYRCVVYVPGDPLHPLKEYASFSQFEAELSRRLRSPAYRQFFMRFIKLGDRAEFLSSLDKSLSVKVTFWSTNYVQVDGFDLDAESNNDLFLAIYRQHAEQVLADARLLVVPTDDEDEKSRLARLETYKAIGLNALLFMGALVPMVGEALFAVAGIQLLATVYEGVAAWAAGEQELAADYLFDTIENLIVMAALGAVGMVGSGIFKTVGGSDFVSRLRKVPISPQGMRLWKADLAAYRAQQSLPQGLEVSGQGLVTLDRNQYLNIGSDYFAVEPKQNTNVWQVRPPQSGRYLPVLETNGAGAWRHDSELLQEWSLLTLFRRLGYRADRVPDAQASQILASVGADEFQLRRLFTERRRPMATLADTVRRFRADAAVNRFMQQMGRPASAAAADADLQLFLLTSSDNWPNDTVVSVVDSLGNELKRYGPATAVQQLKLAQELLQKGTFYPSLLAGLKNPQRMLLLGTPTQDPVSQIAALVELLASRAEGSRSALFERLDSRTDIAGEPLAAPVIAAFPGLPGAVADELALYADASEWEQLKAGKLPLRIGEEARRYQQVVSLNRAYEGLYLDAPRDLNTDLIVLDTLARLPGWPEDVFIEITEQNAASGDRAQTGPADARHKVSLKALAARYRAVDANGRLLAESASNTRAHYFQTLWLSLPVHARKALGVEADVSGVTLRQKITASALQRRDEIARLVARQSWRSGYRSPMGLADPRGEPVVEFKQLAPVLPIAKAAALRQRARELYPLHSLARIESFLMTLGDDEVLAIRSLEELRQQYLTMRNTLEQWINSQTHYQKPDGTRLTVPRRSKSLAAQAILRAWRKESETVGHPSEILDSLTFDAQPLGLLPTIIGDFRHIGALEMNGVGDSAGLNAFLKNFPNLHVLNLTGNGLTRVPAAINEMPRLTHLDLSDNQISLTAEATSTLAAKDHLQSLNLSFNPGLGQLPSFAAMRNLQHLAVRGSGVGEWPAGLDAHPALRTVDLRDNQIKVLADAIFKARVELNRGTNVDGNPLSAKTLEDIARYQQTTGVNLGVTTAEYVHPPVGALPDSAPGAHWLNGLEQEDVPRMQAAWTSLSAYPYSRDFFLVLDQMRSSADDSRQHAQLAARVWNLLQAAAEDDGLRSELFRMARIGRVSANGPEGLFSDLEIRVLCYRAMRAARTGERSLEGELVRLLRGLFRLQELQKQALIDIGNRLRNNSISRQQALELGLVYRVRLANRLELPAQPTAVNAGFDVEVTGPQLNKAYAEVVKAENSSALLDMINVQSFWTQYLRTTYQGLFLGVQERTARAFAELETQNGLSRAAATQKMMAIMDNYRNETRDLYRNLTQQALARHPGLAMPELATAGR